MSSPLATRVTPSRSSWDAVVIGTGVGGCATAARLAAAGQRVLVLEKNPVVGGILASLWRNGFKMDLGSHLVAHGSAGPIGQLLRDLDLERPRLLTHPIPMRSRGIFEATAPTTRAGLPAVALQAARDLGLSPQETANMARLVFHLMTLTEGELGRWDHRTLDEFIAAHTQDPRLYYLFAFLASIFFVLPPWRVSAGESIRCLRSLLRAYRLSYVEGGMDALPRALLGVVEAAGGEVLTGQQVVAVHTHAGGLEVHTAQGLTCRAPVVAANMAPVDLLALLSDRDLPAGWCTRVRAIQPSGAAHQLKLALDRPLLDEGCFIGGISTTGLGLGDLDMPMMRRTVDAIDRGELADPLPVYAPIPTNFDPSLAPPGCQLIVVSAYGPTTTSPVDGPERWRQRALDALSQVIPDLDAHLVFAEFHPVPQIGAWMGKGSRAAICNGQSPDQVASARLPVATPVAGLYIVGDGAGGRGIGIELAASSAREAVALILRGVDAQEAV